MTRRLTIVLDESVTETECGECRFRRPHPVSVRSDICTNDGLIKSFPRPLIPYGERTLECLEAERAAARMVEIDPEDAVGVAGILVRPDMKGRGIGSRVLDAIKAHARKAGR